MQRDIDLRGDESKFVGPVTGLPTVPIELLDAMIDLVSDDPVTLKACALASRSTLRTAQRHLFAAVQLDPPTINAYHQHPNSCDKFHNLISVSPHLATYVRHLSIVDGYHRVSRKLMHDEQFTMWLATFLTSACRCAWVTEDEVLPKVLPQLANIKSLTIQIPNPLTQWGDLSTEVQNALFTTITRPQISKIELLGAACLLPSLKAASGLKSLSLYDKSTSMTFGQDSTPEVTETRDMCQLESLDICCGSNVQQTLLTEAKSWLDLSSLRSLVLRGPPHFSEYNHAFFECIFASPATLVHLKLHLRSRA